MAIVINGSGTVTGLAVGGLPDGTVDSGTLATDSVTSAKLEASAITGADLPAGSVLQVVSGETTTQTVMNSTTYAATYITAAITPSSTSSKILVSITSNLEGNTAGERAFYAIYRGSTNIAQSYMVQSAGTSGSPTFPIAIQKLDSPSSTSAVTYQLYIKRTTGTIVANINNTSGNTIGVITLMEIAG